MNRRGFLQGVFGGVTAAGLVVAASAKDIAAFASPLAKDVPLLLDLPPRVYKKTSVGEHLYNAQREVVAVVTRVDVTHSAEPVDVTMFGDTTRTLRMPEALTRPEIYIEAVGVGWVEAAQNRLWLRGKR